VGPSPMGGTGDKQGAATPTMRPSGHAGWLQPVLFILAFAMVTMLITMWLLHSHSIGTLNIEAVASSMQETELPFYELVAIIYMTGSQEDVSRLKHASASWLLSSSSLRSFTFVCLICADDPDVWRLYGEEHVAVLPCRHGYPSLITKGIEGYRYVAENFRFSYVMKTDIDTVVPMDCVAQAIRSVDQKECPSFGMGFWYPGNHSKVWTLANQLYGPKFHNEAYLHDTGHEYYSPYPSGWAIIWTADVAKFLGMFGQKKPRWRRSWTVDDAGIGTFLVGVDLCRLPLPCSAQSGLASGSIDGVAKTVNDDSSQLQVGPGNTLTGFEGPLNDDVPGPGDLANVQASSLGNCAHRCQVESACKSFEYSPTVKILSPVRNCQLAVGTKKSGIKYLDFSLYVKLNSTQLLPTLPALGAG